MAPFVGIIGDGVTRRFYSHVAGAFIGDDLRLLLGGRPTRTQTVIAKSNRGYGVGLYDVAVTGRFASADAAASVVGYFLKPEATELDCVTNIAALDLPAALGSTFSATAACADGYVLTGVAANEALHGTKSIIINKLGRAAPARSRLTLRRPQPPARGTTPTRALPTAQCRARSATR